MTAEVFQESVQKLVANVYQVEQKIETVILSDNTQGIEVMVVGDKVKDMTDLLLLIVGHRSVCPQVALVFPASESKHTLTADAIVCVFYRGVEVSACAAGVEKYRGQLSNWGAIDKSVIEPMLLVPPPQWN
jgi:hypothetical protein